MTLKSRWAQGGLILLTLLVSWYVGQRQTLFALVYGDSMEPTLHSGQMLRLDHALPRQIPRGTIVLVSRFPRPPFIKRIVGLPDEIVSFELGEVFINGKMLRESYLPDSQTTFSFKHSTLLPKSDEYVLLGDNRLTSDDSREHGIVARDKIIGSIDLPWAPARLLGRPHYRITKDGNRPTPRVRGGDTRELSATVTAEGFPRAVR